MRRLYNDMDICFRMEGIFVRVLNIVFEQFTRTIPAHMHGSGCYEIHYVPCGNGKLSAEGRYYDIAPNTLFVTGRTSSTHRRRSCRIPCRSIVSILRLTDRIRSVGRLPSWRPSPVCDSGMDRIRRAYIISCSSCLPNWNAIILGIRNR